MKRIIPVLMVAVLAVAGTTFADTYGTVDLQFVSASGGPVGLQAPSGLHNTTAGPYGYQLSNFVADITHPTAALSNGSYSGFCIDLTGTINYTSYTGFQVKDLADVIGDPTKRTNVLKLFTEYASPPANGNLVNPAADDKARALTVAIWEVLNETQQMSPFAVSGANQGNTYVASGLTSGAIALADTWLSNANLAAATPYGGNVYALYKQGVQGQEIVLINPLSPDVPEPMAFVRIASLGLFGLPIGALAFYRRRRQA